MLDPRIHHADCGRDGQESRYESEMIGTLEDWNGKKDEVGSVVPICIEGKEECEEKHAGIGECRLSLDDPFRHSFAPALEPDDFEELNEKAKAKEQNDGTRRR